MSKKAVREYDGKRMLARWLQDKTGEVQAWDRLCQIAPKSDIDKLPAVAANAWLNDTVLVAKPDQLIKRRGKAGLVLIRSDFPTAAAWITERRNKEINVFNVTGVLDHFLIEKFWPHAQQDEYYVCIQVQREHDEILFYHEGGIDVGDVDAKALKLCVPAGQDVSISTIITTLLLHVAPHRQQVLAQFIQHLFQFCAQLHYSYLEINPVIVVDDYSDSSNSSPRQVVVPFDMAAKIDEAAKFATGSLWGAIDFPAAFGRPLSPEEMYIQELDARTGASLKLTLLNAAGRIWTMVAGGGASVIYADTIADLGGADELANYGEYSGAPDEEATYNYARTVLSLMTKTKDPRGKILIIGGGIANFTNVAETFSGIVRALTQVAPVLRDHSVSVYVRRGGPNYEEGLAMMRKVGEAEGLSIQVYGPETHMTAIVSMALGHKTTQTTPRYVPALPESGGAGGDKSLQSYTKRGSVAVNNTGATAAAATATLSPPQATRPIAVAAATTTTTSTSQLKPLFTRDSKSIVYGMQPGAVQNMLDFDFLCSRSTPSVAAVVYPFSGNHYQKFYWRTQEILIPVFASLQEAVTKCCLPPATATAEQQAAFVNTCDSVVNFSSYRSVFDTTTEILQHSAHIRTIAIIAEGVPERATRLLLSAARAAGVVIIGPATVGGVKAGCFRIGNAGGALDNIIAARLYRPGSVAYVTRSGGMSNELNNILAHNTNGVYEGIAIGGDQYPGTTFVDHLHRYQQDDQIKMIVVLGEVGGREEYKICEMIKSGKLTKPVVAWCIGTVSSKFTYEVQFGHAGACAGSDSETAIAKNEALAAVGCFVPRSFDDLGSLINTVYAGLVESGAIVVAAEPAVPSVPVDYAWARKLGLIRKPAAFVSSIVDERGEELEYAGMTISEVLSDASLGVGGVIGLLWFRRRLPAYVCRFLELVLQVTADHGPAVAGAHNTIVATRAGKDLISSLCSGLLTIGPRFGGALDGAAALFAGGFDTNLTPAEFVDTMRRQKTLIAGIGHKIKSLDNPDKRVVIVVAFAHKYFPTTQVLDYARAVEQITTKKKSNLILNVDGAIACAFVDLLRGCGAFTQDEANEYVAMGTLNGLFVLGRTIGFIGHFLDQNRLKQPLYRHPTEDISYITKDVIGL